jgi:hypothetical protein
MSEDSPAEDSEDDEDVAREYGLSDPRLRHFQPMLSDSVWGAPRVDLLRLSVGDLAWFRRRLTKRLGRFDDDEAVRLHYSRVEPRYFVADWSPAEPSYFLLWPHRVDLEIVLVVHPSICGADGVPSWIEALIKSTGRQRRMQLQRLPSKEARDGRCLLSARFSLPRVGLLSDALAYVDALGTALTNLPENQDPTILWQLLQSGMLNAFVGVPESHWFEAKSEPYRLAEDAQRLELAKDVSAMANVPVALLSLAVGR